MGYIFLSVVLIIIAVILLIILLSCIVIVPQANAYVVEFLGAYRRTWEAGLHIKVPFVERVARKVSLKESVADFPPQPVITKDNVTMMIDTVVFYYVFDPKMYTYGVNNPIQAIENLSATTIRDIIGGMSLDETLTSREAINTRITAILDEATDRWGIKINRVELKNILPPREIQDAMEKQMKAERERREAILRAEGDKESKILVAQGQKEAKILAAQAEKEAAILQADAVREKKIREADGEAKAILAIQTAEAESIRLINEANPSKQVIALRSLESMEKKEEVADERESA